MCGVRRTIDVIILKELKGRTIRKVMGGGWGKNQKNIGKNAKKKNSCKEEGKEKKIHAEGRSNCDFYSIII